MSDNMVFVVFVLAVIVAFSILAGIFLHKSFVDGHLAGNLIVVEDRETGPLLFLELLDPGQIENEYVQLKVRKNNKSYNEVKNS